MICCFCFPDKLPSLAASLALTRDYSVDGGVIVVPAARQPREVLHRLAEHRRIVSKSTIRQCITCCVLRAMAAGTSPLEHGLCTVLRPACRSADSRWCAGQELSQSLDISFGMFATKMAYRCFDLDLRRTHPHHCGACKQGRLLSRW